jgi:uncharacterized protein (DUF1499 family)
MSLLRWFTKNWANTTEPTHPDLSPLELPAPVPEAAARVKTAAGTIRGWSVHAETDSTLHLLRRTRVFRFVDDIKLTLEPTAAGTRVHAESRSRVGSGDLGQNRRNILELWKAIASAS